MQPEPWLSMESIRRDAWNGIAASFPRTHILQTWEWGLVKSRYGWTTIYLLWVDNGEEIHLTRDIPSDPAQICAATLVLSRSLTIRGRTLPVRVMYAPKGPMLRDWADERCRKAVFRDLVDLAKANGAVFIKVDPDIEIGTGVPGSETEMTSALGAMVKAELGGWGWHLSREQIQFRNTVQIDLSVGEEALLDRMKQKTRYNIRLAERKGVTVRQGSKEDIDLLYRMYAETSARDHFVIRDSAYYRHVWSIFIESGMAEPLIAMVGEEPVGAVMLFQFGKQAWYLYGMSLPAHREKMPNHLLQWEAIQRAKQSGINTYDLWGAPDEFNDRDPLWGVYRFKEGLGGEVIRYAGAWDYPARPLLYRLYSQILPRLLEIMRRRGKQRVRQELAL